MPRPRELAQLDDMIWVISNAYMKTLMWSGWNPFVTQGYLHPAQCNVPGIINSGSDSAKNYVVRKHTLPSIQKHVAPEKLICHYK